MKFLYFTFLFGLAYSKNFYERQDLFKVVHEECQKNPATQLSEEVCLKLRHGENVENKNAGPHIFCLNEKLDIQEKSGEINIDTIKRSLRNMNLSPNEINSVLEKCITTKLDDTKYKIALNVYKCLNNYVEHYDYGLNREKQFRYADEECQLDPENRPKERDVKNLKYGLNVDNEMLRKYIFCLSKKVGLLNENGKLNREVIQDDLQYLGYSTTNIQEIMEECSSGHTTYSIDANVLNIFRCLRKYWHKQD